METERQRKMIAVGEELYERIKKHCDKEDIKISRWVAKILENELDNPNPAYSTNGYSSSCTLLPNFNFSTVLNYSVTLGVNYENSIVRSYMSYEGVSNDKNFMINNNSGDIGENLDFKYQNSVPESFTTNHIKEEDVFITNNISPDDIYLPFDVGVEAEKKFFEFVFQSTHS